MELRDHLIGPCARVTVDDQVEVDVGALVRRLILFERYTLHTVRLREVPALVRAFGEGGLRALLADGCLRIFCDAASMGQVASLAPPGTLPAEAMRFSALHMADRRSYVSKCLREVHEAEGLTHKQVKALKLAVVDALVELEEPGELAMEQLHRDLAVGSQGLVDGIALALRREARISLDPAQIRLDIEVLDGRGAVLIDSNLRELVNLGEPQARHVIERGVLALGHLNIRIELMQRLEGISGCEPEELSLFEGRLRSLLTDTDPDSQEARFLRVQELAELPEPDLMRSPAIDVDALLAARELPEAQTLRSWLRGADRLTDDEIASNFDAVREALGRAMRSNSGKAVRLAISTAVGFVPGGSVISAGLGVLDSFLLERVIPEPGPYSFLSHTWPSLFTGS